MKGFFLFLLSFSVSLSISADETDLTDFAKSYFAAWKDTQAPDAKAQDIERYLSFLHEDIGHQHLPYDPDDARLPDGKKSMRSGMLFYLGAHTSYAAELKQVIPANNVVVITYSTKSSGIHPQTKELIHQSYDTMEVLEIEDGKVSVVRKYSE
ncbi:MAG: nuclear transport factor 2 family protein [Alteromonadaceae bacterium]|nr:nuclear transport factor 2 family protein [Alteromonadaceae bacterium]